MKIILTISLLTIAVFAANAQNDPQIIPDELPPKIVEFLKPNGELKRPKAAFTGEVITLPEETRESLRLNLFLHNFTIVKMKISRDISSAYEELLIITDAKTGNVVSYIWQHGLADPPESFSTLMMAYPNETWNPNTTWPEMGPLAKINALGSAILYMERDTGSASRLGIKPRIGSLGLEEKNKSYVMTAELIPWFSARAKLILDLNWVRDIDDPAKNDYRREYSYGLVKIVVPNDNVDPVR